MSAPASEVLRPRASYFCNKKVCRKRRNFFPADFCFEGFLRLKDASVLLRRLRLTQKCFVFCKVCRRDKGGLPVPYVVVWVGQKKWLLGWRYVSVLDLLEWDDEQALRLLRLYTYLATRHSIGWQACWRRRASVSYLLTVAA